MRVLRSPLVALILCSVFGQGCDDDDRAVPFKRPDGTAPAPDGVAPGTPTQAPGAAGGPRESHSFPEGTARLELPGAPPFEHPHALVLAALPADLDGDGDEDLLLLSRAHADPESELPPAARLERVERGADGWSAPVGVPQPEDAQCALQAGSLRALGPQLALASVTLDCPGEAPGAAADPQAGAARTDDAAAAQAPPAPPEPDSARATAPPRPQGEPGIAAADGWPRTTRTEHHLLSLERNPRRLFRIGIEPGAAAEVAASFEATDQDGDGHSDVQLDLRVTPSTGPAQGQAVDVRIALLNRPGGLARDPEQPEQTLIEFANDAKRSRKGKPEAARMAAARALVTHGALCREGGEAAILVDGQRGLPCGVSLAAGRAASVLAAVAASQGRLRDALALAEQALDGLRYRLTDNDRNRIDYAFAAALEDNPTAWVRGPAITLASAPGLRRPALAFIDDRTLLVRGPDARAYDLSTGQLSPVGIDADLLLRDPAGPRVLTDIVRDCEGYRLRIADAGQLVAGVLTTGAAVAEPLVIAAPPPPAARCPQALPEHMRRDHGGLHPLAWTKSGVLFERAGQLLLLELDAAGQAAAAARELSAGEPIPRIDHSTALTPDGALLALTLARGVLIIDRRSGKERLLPLPQGTTVASDVALSASGKRVALLASGQLWIAGGAGAQPATVPAAIAPTQPAHAPPPHALPPPAPPEPDSPDEG